jgi:hypothetical protein
MTFELTKIEQERLDEMIQAVKVLHGDKVSYSITYCFSTGSGIGIGIEIIIKSTKKDLFEIKKNITDYDSW